MKYLTALFICSVLASCTSATILVSNSTKSLPKPIGPYSHATHHKELIFISGQIGIDPLTNTLKTSIEEQTTQIFENLKLILKESESDLNHIKKTTIFITDMKQFEIVNKIYRSYFTNQLPARSTIEVVALPNNASIEIECIAVKK